MNKFFEQIASGLVIYSLARTSGIPPLPEDFARCRNKILPAVDPRWLLCNLMNGGARDPPPVPREHVRRPSVSRASDTAGTPRPMHRAAAPLAKYQAADPGTRPDKKSTDNSPDHLPAHTQTVPPSVIFARKNLANRGSTNERKTDNRIWKVSDVNTVTIPSPSGSLLVGL